MNNSKIHKIYIIAFLVLLTLPLILLNLRIKINDPFTSKKISANFTRNFPLKLDYFKIYKYIKEDVFHSLPNPKKVIKWKDDWYFLGDDYSNNFKESKGLLLFKKKELIAVKENLNFKKQWCKAHNMTYIMSIAPNKESVYGNIFPIKQYGNQKKMYQIDSICKVLAIPFVDLGKQIPNSLDRITYHKADTHWNDYGAYFGYKEFIEKMRLWYPSLNISKPNAIDQYKTDKTWSETYGDLKKMYCETGGDNSVDMYLSNGSKVIKNDNRLIQPKRSSINPTQYELRYTAPVNNNVKIVFFRDSFSDALVKFMPENFKKSLFIFQREFDLNVLREEKPMFVVEEYVEREVDLLFEEDNILNK